jgi:2Fe-2S ferredoxin
MRVRNVALKRTPTESIEVALTQGESLLAALLAKGAALAHDCDGAAACGTCLVTVNDARGALQAVDDDEQYVLDRSVNTVEGSRAACLAIAAGGSVVVEV